MKRGSKGGSGFLALVYFIFGLYLVNYGFGLFEVPGFMLTYEKWILTFAGFILFIAAYRKIVYSKGAIIKRFMKKNRFR